MLHFTDVDTKAQIQGNTASKWQSLLTKRHIFPLYYIAEGSGDFWEYPFINLFLINIKINWLRSFPDRFILHLSLSLKVFIKLFNFLGLNGILTSWKWFQSHWKTPDPIHRQITSCRYSLWAEGLPTIVNVHLC